MSLTAYTQTLKKAGIPRVEALMKLVFDYGGFFSGSSVVSLNRPFRFNDVDIYVPSSKFRVFLSEIKALYKKAIVKPSEETVRNDYMDCYYNADKLNDLNIEGIWEVMLDCDCKLQLFSVDTRSPQTFLPSTTFRCAVSTLTKPVTTIWQVVHLRVLP